MNIKLLTQIRDKRDRRHLFHIAGSFFFRGGSVLISFLSVRYAVGILLPQEYGVWLTIYSVASWIFLLDGGLGNGLKNKLTQVIIENNYSKGKKLVSTAYISIGLLMAAILLLVIISSLWIEYGSFFNVELSMYKDTALCFLIVLVCVAVKFIFDLINSVFLAFQKAALVHLVNFLSSLLTYLCLVLFFSFFEDYKLVLFGLIMTGIPLLFYLITNVYFFSTSYKQLKPSFKSFEKKYLSDLLSLGVKFFIIQFSVLIIFSSDNFIITQLFGAEAVTSYNISYKLYSVFTVIWTIILTPYWTAFTEAYHKQEFDWIIKTVKRLEKAWLVLVLGVIIVTLICNYIYLLWLGEKVKVDYKISISMALFIIITTLTNIYVYVINGVGKIKLQLITSVIIGLLNIPLSIFFAKNLGLGVSGVMYATCFCIGVTPIVNYIQYKKIVTKKDIGIWGK